MVTAGIKGLMRAPRVDVQVGGSPLAESAAQALTGARVWQRLSMPTLCELDFADPPEPLASAEALAPGADLRVALEGHEEPLFVGQVTAVDYSYEASGERRLRVRCYDRLHVLRKRRSVRRHAAFLLSELAQELVSDVGLQLVSHDESPRWQGRIQHSQDDLTFLVDLCERAGLFLCLRGDQLHLLSLRGWGEPLEFSLGATLFEAHVELNADQACRRVRAHGWDPRTTEAFEAEVATPRLGRAVTAEGFAHYPTVPDDRWITGIIAQGADHLRGWAQRELDLCAVGEVVVRGVAEGRTDLCPGRVLRLAGLAERLAGEYVATEVLHEIDPEGGYRCEFSTDRPAPASRGPALTASLGIVSRVDDPEGKGRVRVVLPGLGGVETNWLQVLAPGAGQGKGLVALPDLDDSVLLLVPDDDPEQAVVLGGLFGLRDPGDAGVSGGNTRRLSFRNPGGERIVLDDEVGEIALHHRDGGRLRLRGDVFELHAEQDLVIEAPGKRITIRAAQIDFEEVT